MNPRPEVLFAPEAIAARLAALGAEIGAAYGGRELTVVGLMKSCLVFMADLIRAVPCDLTCHLLRVEAAHDELTGTPRHDIVYYADVPFEGRDVLLLDDILDTGVTLDFIIEHVRAKAPRSLRTCVLIDRPGWRKLAIRPDWAVFTLADGEERFLVGYGLDWREHYRGLPYIGVLTREEARADALHLGRSVGGPTPGRP